MNRIGYKKWYGNVESWMKQHPACRTLLLQMNKGITLFVYVEYLFLMAWLLLQRHKGIWMAAFTPGLPFILVSIFRKYYNAPRPYEKYGTQPIIPKYKKGNSFPSRHVFSVFVIAVTMANFFPSWGLATAGAGFLLAAVRVIGGVHFLKDVVAGALAGILSGVIGIVIGRVLGV